MLIRNSLNPADAFFPGWLDTPEALDILESVDLPQVYYNALRDLIVDGFTVLKGVTDPALCDAVVADYANFCAERPAYVEENLDELGREKRLVNFHISSTNEMEVVTNPAVMELLDFLFGERACVYTSLTFKYGTQQPIHRDTPHFATWPDSRFCGMWTALEDVHPDAGPLMYIRGGHRFQVDQYEILRNVQRDRPDLSEVEQNLLALDIYNGRIIDEAPQNGELVVAPIKKGDVVIWHAQTPHGGTPAADPSRTRWSVVAHCAPETVQVHQHDRFFRHDSEVPPPARYGFGDAFDRKIAVSGETAFM